MVLQGEERAGSGCTWLGRGIPDLGMGAGGGVGRHPVALPVVGPLCPVPLQPEALPAAVLQQEGLGWHPTE